MMKTSRMPFDGRYFHPGQLPLITTSTYRRARTGNSKSDLREGNAEMLLSLRGISMTV